MGAPTRSPPDGMVWVDAETADGTAGQWLDEDEAYGLEATRELHEDDFYGRHLRVPADEPAMMADLLRLAADVAAMERRWTALATRLTGVASLLDMRSPADG